MEISDIRRRLRMAVEEHRKTLAERRVRIDAATAAYSAFLQNVAVPVFKMFANVAKAEGYPFGVNTPGDGVRLVSERNDKDFVEIWLDTSLDPPEVGTRVNRQRGRDVLSREGLLGPGTPIVNLDDETVLAFLISELGTFIDR